MPDMFDFYVFGLIIGLGCGFGLGGLYAARCMLKDCKARDERWKTK